MDYDETSPESIEAYGRKMIGMTFRQMYERALETGQLHFVAEKQSKYLAIHANKNYKGGIGNLVEECWFGYEPNSDPQADFAKAGVELKVTPYKKLKKNKFSAKERLVITMINYMDVVKERDFEHSHLWKKAKLMLLVWYLHEQGHNDIDSTVDFVDLFTPPAEDLAIIKDDYKKILTKIRAGKAHELSEGDTFYLGACTKSSSSAKRTQQPYSDEPAKPRAFSFKNSYMTAVLNKYIIPHKKTYKAESILKSEPVDDFANYVTSSIAHYCGKSVSELCELFGIETCPKDIYSKLAFRILGVKSNQCEEFEKAGIVVKAIKIEHNGRIKESMSFPDIKYREFAQEQWEDSTMRNYFSDTKFFWVIYRADKKGEYHLIGSMFWNMPYKDLEGDLHDVWQETHDIIANGKLIVDFDKKGRKHTNLPRESEHTVSHVRPHGRDSNDLRSLPEGKHLTVRTTNGYHWDDDTKFTKQCFWLNKAYVLKQIKEHGLL